ncbi:MAG: phenylacetate--CoA ligase family protein [Lachnospiraceae bacterium]|nr:phenylacetate--CoA ligase family protein [Lachnospiraceae bacterium]
MSVNGWIKRNLYWANDYIHGKKVRRFYEDLKEILSDSSRGYVLQQQHLKDILCHAVENSSFYSTYKSDCLSVFPVVNKTILNENYEAICVPIEKIPEQVGDKIHIQKTSGSTGTPFAIPQDARKRQRRIAELKYFSELVGFKSHEMLGQCRIWTKWQSKSKWQSFKENIIPINISKMDDDTIAMLIRTIKKYKIVALRAYASWYDALVDYLESGKGNPGDIKTVKVCISSSEALNESVREKMKEITGIPIVEAYANEEAGMLAQQKIGDNNYYLNHSGYVFEFLKLDSDKTAEPGELSRVVITDLFNYAFPLIRYDTGDTAIYQKGNEVSKGWDYISELYGRRLDLIYNTNGQPVHPMNFARILKNLPGITQWQFVQKGEKEYVIKLNITQNNNVDNTIYEIKTVLGNDAKITVEYVNDIPILASGKRKPVICEWKHD